MRKILLASIALFCALNANNLKHIDLYESPSCGCCEMWAEYMKKNGYEITIHKSWDFAQAKADFGIKSEFQSCHTGVIEIDGEKYALEGHLPIAAIEWFIAHKPKNAVGISVPGMPQGSPGMDFGIAQEYPVMVLYKDGSATQMGIFKKDKKLR